MTEQSAQIKPSSSVILLQPGPSGAADFQVFLLRRAGGNSFMPNRFVFPGGKVEPGDGDDPASLEAALFCALREMWEECGVLLAREPDALAALDGQTLARARTRMYEGDQSLVALLSELGLSPDTSALTPYARWVTPEARPMRFDTRFFFSRMPQGQTASADRYETTVGLWLSPAEALAENLAGRVELAPPQVRILGELARAESLEALLEQPRPDWDQPIEPVLCIEGKSRVILLPDDPDYPAGFPQKPAQPCPAGQATRLLHQKGLWLPHRA